MRHFFKTSTRDFFTFCMLALLFSSIGCGAVGPPIPPEKVGIEAKILKQQQDQSRKEGSSDEDPFNVPLEEAVELPTVYPIDTR
jgi:predicted small lipoprotein YifL